MRFFALHKDGHDDLDRDRNYDRRSAHNGDIPENLRRFRYRLGSSLVVLVLLIHDVSLL